MAVNAAVRLALSGAISPHVAVSRMLLAGADAAGIAAAVERARPSPDTPAWTALSRLLEGRAAELDRLAAEIRATGANHAAVGGTAGIAAFFDRAVAAAPAAGAALYSLNDPAILAEATAEIMRWIDRERLLQPDACVLDVGCGTGRIAAALAPRCARVVGIDVSAGMIAEARRQHGGTAGLEFELADGSALPDGPFGLALLVDSMPYVHQAGLADDLMDALAARVPRGGAVAVLNLSYGRDADADPADARRWAARHGWRLTTSRPFTLWDGTAFLFRA